MLLGLRLPWPRNELLLPGLYVAPKWTIGLSGSPTEDHRLHRHKVADCALPCGGRIRGAGNCCRLRVVVPPSPGATRSVLLPSVDVERWADGVV